MICENSALKAATLNQAIKGTTKVIVWFFFSYCFWLERLFWNLQSFSLRRVWFMVGRVMFQASDDFCEGRCNKNLKIFLYFKFSALSIDTIIAIQRFWNFTTIHVHRQIDYSWSRKWRFYKHRFACWSCIRSLFCKWNAIFDIICITFTVLSLSLG